MTSPFTVRRGLSAPAVAAALALALLALAPAADAGPRAGARAATANPFAHARFYVDPSSDAARTARAWARQGRRGDAAQLRKVARAPHAIWLNEGWAPAGLRGLLGTIRARGALPVLVLYNIPNRDCGRYSAGGAGSPAAYERWIRMVAATIGPRPAAVIVEPDALAEVDCLSGSQRENHYRLVRYAVDALRAHRRTAIYLDAGNEGWQPARVMASRLRRAGVAHARGFSLNVSNFNWTTGEIRYGRRIARALGGKHFVIDTSRNGRGAAPGNAHCNPAGRGLGRRPTARTGDRLVDAFFWIKIPGESDGTCNGAPRSGAWWPEYALGLARRSA